MQYEEVDKLIRVLAEDITKKVESGKCKETIPEMTKALAALVEARALAN